MKIEFLYKNFRLTDEFKGVVESKINRLAKYFDEGVNAKVFASVQGNVEKLEITISGKNFVYRGETSGENMLENIDLVLPKIERQVIRKKQKSQDFDRKKVADLPFEFIKEEPEQLADVYKKKSFDLDPVLVEDAKYMMEDVGHNFYVFLNAETGKVNVLYKREDGKYGLIEVNY